MTKKFRAPLVVADALDACSQGAQEEATTGVSVLYE
jgi:hypothetical protein